MSDTDIELWGFQPHTTEHNQVIVSTTTTTTTSTTTTTLTQLIINPTNCDTTETNNIDQDTPLVSFYVVTTFSATIFLCLFIIICLSVKMSQVRKNGRQMSRKAKKVKDIFKQKIFDDASQNQARVEIPEVIWPHLGPDNRLDNHEYLALQDISAAQPTNNQQVVIYPKTQPKNKPQTVTADVHNTNNAEPLYEIPTEPSYV